MAYMATCYVGYRGQLYARGEILPDTLTAEEIEMLESRGAILSCTPADAVVSEYEAPDVQEKPDIQEEPDIQDAPIEEPEIEEEAEEIDIMDGLVKADPEPEKPKKKRNSRRKT